MKNMLDFKIVSSFILCVFASTTLGYAQTQETSDETVATFANAYRQEKQSQKSEEKILRKEQERVRSNQLSEVKHDLERMYQDALGAYRIGDYTQAKTKLLELQKYLAKTDVSETVEKIWKKKISALSQKIVQAPQRKSAFEKVQQKKEKTLAEKKEKYMAKVHRDEAYQQKRLKERERAQKEQEQKPKSLENVDIEQRELLARVEQRQKELQAEREQIQKALMRGVESMYAKAVKFYKDKKYWQARGIFQHIQQLKPNYKETPSYLNRVDQILKKESLISHAEKSSANSNTKQKIISKTLDGLK